MTIKNCFIPCAGLGTRMGEVGKNLPKPLWPLFEKSMLEVQIENAKRLGCQNFFANTHHHADKIESFSNDLALDLKLLFEPTLLGNGGNFHNLKRNVAGLETVLVLNPDVFLFMSKRDEDNFLSLGTKGTCLLLMPCSADYNEVHIDEAGHFLKVTPPRNNETPYLTYTGVSILKLSSIANVDGKSSFFDTVVNPQLGNFKTYTPMDSFEYWDFGTKEQYVEGVTSLNQQPGLDKQFLNFLNSINAFDPRASIDGNYKSKTLAFELLQEEVRVYGETIK